MSQAMDAEDSLNRHECAGGSPNALWRMQPAMVYQLLDARQEHRNAKFIINGREVNYITTVASIVRKKSNTTYTDLYLEDGSKLGGRILAKFFHETGHPPTASEREYVRIRGHLERMKSVDANYVVGDNIRGIEHPNEVDFHMLEAMFATMVYKKGPPPASRLRGDAPVDTVMASPLVSAHVTPEEARTSDRDTEFHLVSPLGSPVSTSTDCTQCAGQLSSHQSKIAKKGKRRARAEDSEDSESAQIKMLASWTDAALSLEDDPTPEDRRSTPPQDDFVMLASPSGSPKGYYDGTIHDDPPSSPLTNSRGKPDPYSDLTTLQRSILLYVQSAGPPPSPYAAILSGGTQSAEWEGEDVRTIAKTIKKRDGIPRQEVRRAIKDLIGEGFLYTTGDDCHVKIT